LITAYIPKNKVVVSYMYHCMLTTCCWLKIKMNAIKEVKKQLSSKFDMKDLGAVNFKLVMEIKRD